MLTQLAAIAFVLTAPPQEAGAVARPQYVFINRGQGVKWNAGLPDSFTAESFREIPETIGAPENPELRLGVSFVFDYLRYDLDTLRRSLERFLAMSEETGVPVMLQLDGQNWWEARPDLWNWWDPDKPGYDPDNVYNVEWTGWGPEHAIKISWRNWGRQLRVLPAPNIASPEVLEAHREGLDALLPVIQRWAQQLPDEKRYLFGGVKLGHEASIGYNAYYYPKGNAFLEMDPAEDPQHSLDLNENLAGGLKQLGYAALSTAGIKQAGTVTKEDIAEVTRGYLRLLCQIAAEHGLPPELVYTHQGGTHDPDNSGHHLPFTAAVNEYSTPGWSFYGLDPREAEGLTDAFARQGHQRWAAVEWWWGAPNKAGWREHFEKTLAFGACRFITVFNWNCGYSLKNHPEAHAALRELTADWPRSSR